MGKVVLMIARVLPAGFSGHGKRLYLIAVGGIAKKT